MRERLLSVTPPAGHQGRQGPGGAAELVALSEVLFLVENVLDQPDAFPRIRGKFGE